MLEKLLNCNGIAFDCETTSESGKKKDNLHFKRNRVLCISFANDETSFCLTYDEIMEDFGTFSKVMTDPKIKKIGHNLKFDAKCVFGSFDIKVKGLWFDTHVAAKLLDENEPAGLKVLCKKYLNSEWGEFTDYLSYLKTQFPEAPPKEIKDLASRNVKYKIYMEGLCEYCRLDSVNTWKLAHYQKPVLARQNLYRLFKMEMEVLNVFYNSEIVGVYVELDYLVSLSKKYTRYIKKIERWIYLHTQDEFNLNSPKQLCFVLYDLKKLPIVEKTKSGGPSTGTGALKKLSKDGFRFVDSILLYRHWVMLVRHIDKLVNESINSKIYPTFNTVGTETGRFSCKDPNLQQIPSKTKESLAIRKGFTGNLLVADYSNMELRIMAHYTKDPKLLKVYGPGGNGDLHAQTAELLGVSRSFAKTINFGIGYGMGPNLLAAQLGIDYDKAKSYIDAWYKQYNRVEPWKQMIINTCKKYGFVRSIGGRKRRIDFSKVPYKDTWSAEREVVNFVIQGSSADITKKAMAELKDEMILMQIHDEVVIDMDHSKRSLEEIKHIMENVVSLKVPMTVDAKLCNNWSEGK